MANKKRNALKHGANASEVMLWGEKYKDYEALRDGLYQEFSPSGSTEEYLVQTLLDLRWRRRRLDCYARITTQKRLNEIRQDNKNSRDLEYVAAFAPEFKEADSVEKVEAILSRLPPGYREAILSNWPLRWAQSRRHGVSKSARLSHDGNQKPVMKEPMSLPRFSIWIRLTTIWPVWTGWMR